jgi:hypothetical protein
MPQAGTERVRRGSREHFGNLRDATFTFLSAEWSRSRLDAVGSTLVVNEAAGDRLGRRICSTWAKPIRGSPVTEPAVAIVSPAVRDTLRRNRARVVSTGTYVHESHAAHHGDGGQSLGRGSVTQLTVHVRAPAIGSRPSGPESVPRDVLDSTLRTPTSAPSRRFPSGPLITPCRVMVVDWAHSVIAVSGRWRTAIETNGRE